MLAGDGEPGAGELFAGYALSFIGVLVVVGLVGWLVRKLVQSVGLSGLDRMLGLALGLARGAFVACALVLVLGLTGDAARAAVAALAGGAGVRAGRAVAARLAARLGGRASRPGRSRDELPAARQIAAPR